MSQDPIEKLTKRERAVWIAREPQTPVFFDSTTSARHIADADTVWRRFAPALASLFETPGGSGRIESPLLEYPASLVAGSKVFVKADHALPITATVKARGGVFALLRVIETIAERNGLLGPAGSYKVLTSKRARRVLASHTIVVASTGNLGWSIGLVATAFGLKAEVHMSDCAKAWKKSRLRALGVTVIEYKGDYTATVTSARASVGDRDGAWFIDDENSWDLFLGYTGGGRELASQLGTAGVEVTPDRPLVVYLPCGVGGAPGGITYGLKTIYGPNVICVFAEPIEAACMLVALASGQSEVPSVYDVGLDGCTDADGLAVSRASELVLRHVGHMIDAAVAVDDRDLLHWVRRAWVEAGIKLEPSAAAGFAALAPFLEEMTERPPAPTMRPAWRNIGNAVHVVWTTGGNLIPHPVFRRLLKPPRKKSGAKERDILKGRQGTLLVNPREQE